MSRRLLVGDLLQVGRRHSYVGALLLLCLLAGCASLPPSAPNLISGGDPGAWYCSTTYPVQCELPPAQAYSQPRFYHVQLGGGGISGYPLNITLPSNDECLLLQGPPWVIVNGSCTGSASTAWANITGGTNTTAAMLVGAGASLGYTSTGVVNANEVLGLAFPSLVSGDCLGNNGSALSWVTCGTSSGAVSSITAGSSGDLNITPTTGAAVADLASQANATVCANVSGSSGIPACNTTLPALQGAMNAANATTCTPTLAAGATNDFDPTTGGTACTLSSAGITNVGYVSAIPGSGGSTLDGILAGSDKQQIWLKDNAPVGPPTQTAASTATTGGIVAAGTYYLVWTATFANGETLRSNEESETTTGSTSTITGNIAQAVPGATGYRVYLGTSAGGESVYYTVSGGSTLTYTITTTSGTSGSPPTTYNAWIKLSVDSSSESTVANLLCGAGNSVLMPQGYVYLFYTTGGDCWSIGTVTNSYPSLDMLASGTSMTPDASFDFVSETASASGAFTINCPSTNPPPWHKQIFVIVNYSGSANTYTWGSCYHASSTVALPSGGTAAGAEDIYLDFWDLVLQKQDITAINQGF